MKSLFRSFFDVRPGEFLRTFFMAMYLMLVLFAYYILKPLSRSLFLNKFDIDKLPYLYILIALAGGLLAYLYTKVALRFSLHTAVNCSTILTVACLVALWWLIGLGQAWVLYAFNIWVSLFSVMLVSQGWLIASNVFTPREAKRLYGLLGMGAVAGAAFGGTFIAQTVTRIGSRNQLLASAALVVVAYGAFLAVLKQKGVSLTAARGAEGEVEEFEFRDILVAIGRQRHLQIIIGIITLTFIVDVTIEYQFNAMAKLAYRGDELTAFLGNFYGIYLNLITFGLQFFLTAIVVSRLGVGGTLQIMPVTLSVAALATYFAPGVYSSSALRLAEAATRYTLNRTGMELLYLPLPAELRNRTKAFVDIFVDRMGRGLGGMILILCTTVLLLKPTQIALVTAGFSLVWMALSVRASRQYLVTVRERLASRRLDLGDTRTSVEDPRMLALIQQAAMSDNPRQAVYALSLLADAPGFDLTPILQKLAQSSSFEVRAKVYELARAQRFNGLAAVAGQDVLDAAMSEAVRRAAAAYQVALSDEPVTLAEKFLQNSNLALAQGALDSLSSLPDVAHQAISLAWLREAAHDPDPQRRSLAARAAGLIRAPAGDSGTDVLLRLLEDPDPPVVAAACGSAGAIGSRAHVAGLLRCLLHARQRGPAISSLAAYGTRLSGTLADILQDESASIALRRQIPRVLKQIPDQQSVETLLRALRYTEPTLRRSVLKALNRLRETAVQLQFEPSIVNEHIRAEARRYCELNAQLEPFRSRKDGAAAGLLARSLEDRMRRTLEELFRLLGLRYPLQEIYAAYLALSPGRSGARTSALEYLDNILERDLKKVIIPLLDAPERLAETAKSVLGVQPRTAETALRELLQSGDSWLAPCAAAAAGELRMQALAADITRVAQSGSVELAEVARSAAMALA